MKRIENESLLDWYNTRGGRTIVKPPICDRLTAKECLMTGVKKRPKKKIVPKERKQSLKKFIKANYDRTYIEVGTQTITLLRGMSVEFVKRSYPSVKSIYWGNSKEDVFSNVMYI